MPHTVTQTIKINVNFKTAQMQRCLNNISNKLFFVNYTDFLSALHKKQNCIE